MRVASAVFFSGQLERCTAFYKALGYPYRTKTTATAPSTPRATWTGCTS